MWYWTVTRDEPINSLEIGAATLCPRKEKARFRDVQGKLASRSVYIGENGLKRI
jgi:hypothetical protein